MVKKTPSQTPAKAVAAPEAGYADIVGGIVDLLEAARRASARSVNAIMTATYWKLVEGLWNMTRRGQFMAAYKFQRNSQTVSGVFQSASKGQTVLDQSDLSYQCADNVCNLWGQNAVLQLMLPTWD